MRKTVFTLLVLASVLWAAVAWAGAVQTNLDCPRTRCCGTYTCVKLDVKCNRDCCCDCQAKHPLYVDFLSEDNRVLGSAKFDADWCSRCNRNCLEAQLDNPVNAGDVCSLRLVKSD